MMNRSNDQATAVIIAYRKNRLNTRLIFGQPQHEIRRGWHRKLAIFYPGDVFGYERWRGDKYGTQEWTFTVCEAQTAGPLTQITGVMPGAKLLLNERGKTKIKRALSVLDALKQKGLNLQMVPEIRWRDLHQRLKTGECSAEIVRKITERLSC